MKAMLVLFLFSASAFAAEADFTDFSGDWKGECFHGTSYHQSSASIRQTSAESVYVSLREWRPSDQENHSLVGSTKEEFESHADQDEMGPEQFLKGSSKWSWCNARDKIRICNQNEWFVWTTKPANKTLFSSTFEMQIVSGKLETKYRELYKPVTDTDWAVNVEMFCRYEKR